MINIGWNAHREQLYLEYRQEMDDMQELEYNEAIYEADLQDFLEEENEWVPVIHNGEEVGFIEFCAFPFCHPDTDWFLREAYVRPEYRRKGLMQKTLLEWLRKCPGRYCLFIMDKNTPAQKCWHNAFQKAGYKPMNLRDLAEFDDVTIKLYAFEPKEDIDAQQC